MNDASMFSIILLLGWLFVAGSAFASFKLGWGKTVRLALMWVAIFGGLFVLADLTGLALPE